MVEYEERRYQKQFEMFERLRLRIDGLLSRYGRRTSLSTWGDYSAHADFRKSKQVKVSIGCLELLQPAIIYQLQALLKDFPGWEIVYSVTVDGHLEDWPNMGLYIRQHEIVDTLQRQYFPKEFQDISFEGSRRAAEPRRGEFDY